MDAPSKNLQVDADVLESIYTTMRRIRAFEERTKELFDEGIIKGTTHSYIGEEAIAAAVCANLHDDDYIASYHRGHGHCIAKGAKLDRMMAELMGRETGYCGACTVIVNGRLAKSCLMFAVQANEARVATPALGVQVIEDDEGDHLRRVGEARVGHDGAEEFPLVEERAVGHATLLWRF